MLFKKNIGLQLICSFAIYFAYAEQHITVIIPSYNNASCCIQNLNSVFMQNYSNYRVIYIDDCSTDNTGNMVQAYIDKHNLKNKITFIRNTYNRKALANIFKAVHMCEDNDLCVILDGDDTYAHRNVLSFIDKLFAKRNIWMAYAQYINVPEKLALEQKIPVLGYAKPTPTTLIASRNFRNSNVWCWSGLRMFYAGLFKQIKFEHFIYSKEEFKGKFFPTSYDGAIMYPMLEMCGNHFAYIPEILLHRNIDTPLNDFKIHRHIQVLCGAIMKKFAPYPLVKNIYKQNNSKNKIDIIICSDKNQTKQPPCISMENENGMIYRTRSHNLDHSYPIRKIRRICRESRAPYILLMDAENVPFSVTRALYWLNNTHALCLQFNPNLLDPALSIAKQPIEHIEENIYAFCTSCHIPARTDWRGIFKREHLLELLRYASTLQDLNKKISETFKSNNHTVLCAI